MMAEFPILVILLLFDIMAYKILVTTWVSCIFLTVLP